MPSQSVLTPRAGARLLGAGALLASGGIHLDLYITGYHAIPTIGPLFLVQTISALLLGLVLLLVADEFLAMGGALLALGTLAGYVVSRSIGMFGFHELATTAGLVAGLLDTIAFVSLGYFTSAKAADSGPSDGQLSGLKKARGQIEPLVQTGAARAGIVVLGLAALVLTFVEGLGASPVTASPPTSSSIPASTGGSKSVTITINNFAFSPAHITVSPSERIIVHNEDPVAHTLSALPGSSPLGKFDTGNLGPNQTKTVTAPGAAGTYQYYCAIHNYMTGSITVKT